jgi:hypothetical protein
VVVSLDEMPAVHGEPNGGGQQRKQFPHVPSYTARPAAVPPSSIRVFAVIRVFRDGQVATRHSDDLKHSDQAGGRCWGSKAAGSNSASVNERRMPSGPAAWTGVSGPANSARR